MRAALSLFVLFAPLAEAQRIEIAAGGQPRAIIVVADQASPVERLVAEELRGYLGRITGAAFEVRGDDRELPDGVNLIHAGRTRFAREAGIASADLAAEGFRIKTSGRNLFLAGRDDDGTQFAAYEFLEKYCGVRWFWPGESGEEVPRAETLRLPPIDDRQAPWFQRRTMVLSREHRDDPIEMDYWRFGRKWKLGSSLKTVGVHAWGNIAPPAAFGAKHPEYYALVAGTRQRDWTKFDGSHEYQLCTSNPEVVRRSIEWARTYFDEHPDTDILSISPNDGLGFCECERCRAQDSGEMMEIHSRPHPVITDRILTYANAVAEGVAATHPKKRLLVLAYTVYRQPPKKVKPHPNLVIQFADNAEFHWEPKRKAERLGALEGWARLTPNLMIYEYYAWGGHHPARGLTAVIAESIPRFQRMGIRLFRSQSRGDFGLNGLNYYLAAKLLWNPGLDAAEVLDDYFRKCFGNAAAPMKEYFRLLDERWKAAVEQVGTEATPQTSLYYLVSYNAEARTRLRALLEQATRQAKTPAHRDRVAFFGKALRYAELTVAASEKVLALDRDGIIAVEKSYPTSITGYQRPSEMEPERRRAARAKVQEAIAAWEARGEFMDAVKGQWVIDDRYARASDTYYRFNPLGKLREILAGYGKP